MSTHVSSSCLCDNQLLSTEWGHIQHKGTSCQTNKWPHIAPTSSSRLQVDEVTLAANVSNLAFSGRKRKSFRKELWQLIFNSCCYDATSNLRPKRQPLGFGLSLQSEQGRIHQSGTDRWRAPKPKHRQGHWLAVNKRVWPTFQKAKKLDSLQMEMLLPCAKHGCN